MYIVRSCKLLVAAVISTSTARCSGGLAMASCGKGLHAATRPGGVDTRVNATSDSSRQSSASRQLITFRLPLKIFLYRWNLDAYTEWTVHDAFYHSTGSDPAALSRRFHS